LAPSEITPTLSLQLIAIVRKPFAMAHIYARRLTLTDKPAVEDTYEELTEEDFPTDLAVLSEGKCNDIIVAIEDLSPMTRNRFASGRRRGGG
jgi:hypothetical protein